MTSWWRKRGRSAGIDDPRGGGVILRSLWLLPFSSCTEVEAATGGPKFIGNPI